MSRQNIKKLLSYVKDDPKDIFSRFALAMEYWKIGKRDKTRLLLEYIYHKEPEYVGVYYHLGKLNEEENRIEEARKVYSDGISMASQQKDAHAKDELETALAELNIAYDE